jgi:hypothetical protein
MIGGGQQHQIGACEKGSSQEKRFSASKAFGPCEVTPIPNDWLNNQTCQWCDKPKPRQAFNIGTKIG